MKTTLIIIVVVVYTITLTSLFASLMSRENRLRFPTVGNIIVMGYEAYGGDINTTGTNQTLDWGTVFLGTSINRSFTLKSISSMFTIPQLNTTNWTFENAQDAPVAPPTINDFAVDWNLNNTLLAPNEEVNVTITLTVKYDTAFAEYMINNQIRKFSFDIIIIPS